MKRIALIPAYQPEGSLLEVIGGLQRCGFHVVVVNDGSKSEYSRIFEAAALSSTVLVHNANKGKGAALKTGLDYIRRQFEPIYTVVTVDADGQHLLPDIVRVCGKAAACRGALILGRRSFDKAVPFRSRFGNTVTRAVFRMSSGVRLFDTQTGLRAFSDDMIDKLTKISGERYEYEINVLLEAAKAGIPIIEIPIETVYLDGNASSHFSPLKDSVRIYKEILKFSASSLLSFALDYGLYCLLCRNLDIAAANVTARVGSAAFNYTLNRKLVFGSGRSIRKTLPQYALLAAFILLCNTVFLKILTCIGINLYLAKIITEIIMFVFSYTVQHKMIFKKGNRR